MYFYDFNMFIFRKMWKKFVNIKYLHESNFLIINMNNQI
jgi:hypothetical protein